MNFRFLVTTAVGAVMLSASAEAQYTIADVNTFAPNFDLDTIAPILADMGLTAQRFNAEGTNGPFIAASSNGYTFLMQPAACADEQNYKGCRGLNVFAFFTTEAPANSVSLFNSITPGVFAYVKGGQTFLRQYIIGDYGYKRGTLLANLNTFVYAVTVFDKQVWDAQAKADIDESAKTVAETKIYAPGAPAPTDNEAARLNAAEIVTVGGAPSLKDRSANVSPHDLSAEDLAGFSAAAGANTH